MRESPDESPVVARADETGAAGHAWLHAMVEQQRAAFLSQPLPSAAERRAWLSALERALLSEETALCAAISMDFGHRPAAETRLLELFPSLASLRHGRRRLAGWMKPERRPVSFWLRPGRATVTYQPLGVVGIIVPWNYPLYLAVGPLVAALAAGNRALLKLSEHTPAFGRLFASLIAATFPSDLVQVVTGDATVGRAFTTLPFDHLLFTGSGAVARDVMASAARRLTPVTLELGGKSPAIIAPEFDLATAARRIAFGKLVNAGQTCIAPDYVLAPSAALPALVAALRDAARSMYGTAASPDYASIVNDHHFGRLTELLEDAKAHGAHVEALLAAPSSALPRRMPPMAVLGATPRMRILREEIFGPILPLVPYESLDEVIAYVNARARPLAMYVFDDDVRRREALLARTASGGVTINDTLLHVTQDDLPFGGVGESGMGRYHGVDGFRTFSQVRSVYRRSRFALTATMYPPYGGSLQNRILALMLRSGVRRRGASITNAAP